MTARGIADALLDLCAEAGIAPRSVLVVETDRADAARSSCGRRPAADVAIEGNDPILLFRTWEAT